VLVHDYEKAWYKPDGTGYTVEEVYEKILTEKGKRESCTLDLYFHKHYNKVEVLHLELIKPDGRTVPIDIAANSKSMVDASQMGSNIYDPNSQTLNVTIPDLQIGDMVHVITKNTIIRTRIEDTWSEYFVLQSTNPILRYDIEISAPPERPLACKMIKDEVKNTITFSQKEVDGRIIYHWTARDVARIFEEPNMPPYYTVCQRLLVSTVPGWTDISKWYWKISKSHLDKVTPEMKKATEELIKGLKTPEEKINAIFQFVSKKIRYMGITPESVAPGYEPHDVNITFENRYGVCRDKAALLVAMLRVAGFDAFPVLFYSGQKKDVEVPNTYFNHAISAVELEKGKYILMDSTDESTSELLPSYLSDMSYIVARPEGDTLKTSPVTPAAENMLTIRTVGKVTEKGEFNGTATLEFKGINDGAYRDAFSHMKPEQIREFFAARLKSAISGAEITSLKLTPELMSNVAVPLQTVISFKAPDFLIQGKYDTMVAPPWFGSSFGVVNFVLGSTGLKKRLFPLKVFSTCGIDESFKVELPAGLKPELVPKYKPVETPEIKWTRDMKAAGSLLEGSSVFQISALEFLPPQYDTLKLLLKEMEYQKRKMPVFSPAAVSGEQNAVTPAFVEGADAILLNDDVAIDLKGRGEWTVTERITRKILTYAGMKNNSELKIPYNPVWDKISITDAVVKSPDGSVRKLDAKELNLMDAPWSGSAPRYPAGKILVASLPGVQSGSEIQYTITREHKDRPFFGVIGMFRGFDPIVRKTVTLTYDEKLPVNISPAPEGVKESKEVSGGKIRLVWEAANVPAIKSEPSLPPAWCFAPSVFISTGDWKSFGAASGAVLEKAAADQQQAAAMAAELTAKLSTDTEKILAIRNFVAKNIRSAGPEFDDLPVSCVTPADKVLADRYGNTADTAVLLCAMLRAAGVKAEPVLVSGFPDIAGFFEKFEEYPQLVFSGVLVRVQNGQETVFLNDSNQYSALGVCDHNGKYFLNPADGSIGVIKISKDFEDYVKTVYQVKLKPDGDAGIEVSNLFFGDDFGSANQMFSEFTPEKRSRYFQRVVTDISQSAVPVSDLAANFKSYPGKQTIAVNVERYAVREDGLFYFNLPGNMLKDIFKTGEAVRVNPYYRSEPLRISKQYLIEIPEADASMRLLPPDIKWSCPGNGGTVSVKSARLGKNKIMISCTVNLLPCILSPEEYQKLVAIQARLSNPNMNVVMISGLKDSTAKAAGDK
jgi:transglutaminase-like putative cysteine protease